ncbi:hypothetical protein ABT297_41265, partial [Dactylosporangium sp. NPDC000555]|uniref:hypothetical protein n=1 Tax=Dactylosporangium sp. NPDC000555 TaxID=3154260 RepID=UPI00331C2901
MGRVRRWMLRVGVPHADLGEAVTAFVVTTGVPVVLDRRPAAVTVTVAPPAVTDRGAGVGLIAVSAARSAVSAARSAVSAAHCAVSAAHCAVSAAHCAVSAAHCA